jgi:hypothetical protein
VGDGFDGIGVAVPALVDAGRHCLTDRPSRTEFP